MIKAHLIRTSEVDEEVFASVVQYLQQFKGEVEFIHHDAPMVISGRPKRVIKKVDDDFDVQEEFLMNKLCDSEIRLKSVDLDFDKVNAYPWEKFFDLIKKFRKQSNQKEKENPIPALTQEYNATPKTVITFLFLRIRPM